MSERNNLSYMGERKQGLACLVLVALLLIAPRIHAQDNPGHGKEIVQNGANKTTACAGCHGLGGEGAAQAYPRLAGLNARYVVHQLESFKDGTRPNAIMQPIAANLSQQDMADAAAWYGEQKVPESAVTAEASPETMRRGERLAQVGDWSRNQPPCFSCHGPGAAGLPPAFPRLAGQYSHYLLTQLEDFKNGVRRNDREELMRSVAHNMSDQDMQAVATYLAALNPSVESRKTAPGETQSKHQDPGNGSAAVGKDHMIHDMPFTPPPDDEIPASEFGQMVRLGENIFTHTRQYAKQYVGNALRCSNCHLDRGRKPDSAPMWAAYPYYPAYRAKNHKVNTIQDRISGCFRFSENGHPPPMDSREMTALVSYFAWLARGTPSNSQLGQHNYPTIAPAAREPDVRRGAIVFAQQLCILPRARWSRHDGEGRIRIPAAVGAALVQRGRRHAPGGNSRGLHQAQHATRPRREPERSGRMGRGRVREQSPTTARSARGEIQRGNRSLMQHDQTPATVYSNQGFPTGASNIPDRHPRRWPLQFANASVSG